MKATDYGAYGVVTMRNPRLYFLITLVLGCVLGIPCDFLMAHWFGNWVWWPIAFFSVPFVVLDVYWLIFPDRYMRDVFRFGMWFANKLEKIS